MLVKTKIAVPARVRYNDFDFIVDYVQRRPCV